MEQHIPTVSLTHSQSDDIEFGPFMRAMGAFGDMYHRHVAQDFSKDDVKLTIKGVRQGSIIIDIAPVVVAALSAHEVVLKAAEFAEFYKNLVGYFLTGSGRPETVTERDCQNIRTIYAPAAQSVGGQSNISFHGDVNIAVGRIEAGAIQTNAIREIETLKEPTVEIRKEVLLYWHVAKNTPESEAADRGIVEMIDDAPKKILFGERTEIKEAMLGGAGNPFETGFLVDIEVAILRGKVQAYKVLRLHETFEISD